MIAKEDILKLLSKVKYPPYDKDIVSFGMVKYVKVEGENFDIRIFTGGKKEVTDTVLDECRGVLKAAYPQAQIALSVLAEDPAKANAPKVDENAFKGVRYKIAVASGKGGVGKSTVAINLARAFARLFSTSQNARVGLMDCDVHGPSVPLLLKGKVFPEVTKDDKMIPPEVGGIKAFSMGMLVADDQPLIWRGAMVMGALKQFVNDVIWGELDVMVFDLPPGTGDGVLTVAQTIPLDGALIVTTPNKLAALTATRGALLFEKTNIPILGVVENMSYLELPNGDRQYIFGKGEADIAAAKLNTKLLAVIPIDPSLQAEADMPLSAASERLFDKIAFELVKAVDAKRKA